MKSDFKKIFSSYKIIDFLYLAMLLATVLILIDASYIPSDTGTSLSHSSMSPYNTGWDIINSDGTYSSVTLPVDNNAKAEGPVAVTRILDKTECDDVNHIFIFTVHSSIKIYINGNLKYSFGDFADSTFKVPPVAYHAFLLEDRYAGKRITIVTDSGLDKYRGRINSMYIGDRASELIYLLNRNIFAIFTSMLLFALFLIFFIMWISFGRVFKSRSLLYLSLASLFISVWGLSETRIPQFFLHNSEIFNVFNYQVFFLIEMSIIGFFICSRNNYIVRMTRKISFIPVINLIVCDSCLYLGIADLDVTLIFTHFCMITIAVLEIIFDINYRNINRNRKGSRFIEFNPSAIGFMLFALCIMIDIIRYYLSLSSDNASFTRVGILIYVITLGIQSLKGSVNIIMVERESQIYKQLALHDGLTNLSNRTAYQEKLASLNASPTGRVKTIIAMFDINNLKTVNDSLGHEAGDRYIKNCAYFINSYFRDFATLYRIGGDEFSVICSLDDKKKFYNAFEEMKKNLSAADRSKINYAYGYAEFDKAVDETLYDTVKRSDERMYAKKTDIKNGMS